MSELTPLAELKELRTLDVGGPQVSDLAPLAGLKKVTIFLSASQKVKVPKALEGQVRP